MNEKLKNYMYQYYMYQYLYYENDIQYFYKSINRSLIRLSKIKKLKKTLLNND